MSVSLKANIGNTYDNINDYKEEANIIILWDFSG